MRKRTGVVRSVFLDPVTAEDVAEALGLSSDSVRTMVHRGELPKSHEPGGWKRLSFRGKKVRLPSQGTLLLPFAVALVRAAVKRGLVRVEELGHRSAVLAPKRVEVPEPHPDLVRAVLLLEEAKAERLDAERASRLSARDLERMRRAGGLKGSPDSDEELKPEDWSAMDWDPPKDGDGDGDDV